MSSRALIMLADAPRGRRAAIGSRWPRLAVGRQALLVMAHLRKGETYADLACGFGIGTSTVYRWHPPGTSDRVVILDGTLLRIDRVGMAGGRDRPFYSGKPAGRLIWVSPALPDARHDMSATREHGIIDALNAAGVSAVTDTAYQVGGPAGRVPQRRRRLDPDTGRYRRLSAPRRKSHCSRPPARALRAGERRTGELEGPAQDLLQPQPRHRPRPSRPDIDDHRLSAVGGATVRSSTC